MKRHTHDQSLLENALQETRRRDATYNHEINHVRKAVDRRFNRLLIISIVLASISVFGYVCLTWSA
ncbi:MAG: hypothetical protein OSB41_06690 [Kiritimatiellae bacterium]|nr:hypothetical protein [Kiritimatiellia bacterium]